MSSLTELNVVGLDSPHGYKTFRLLSGGIEASDAEVVAISAHANPRINPSGAALRSLGFCDGIPVEQLTPLVLMDAGSLAGTYRVNALAGPHDRDVLVVRIPGLNRTRTDTPLDTFEDTLWSLFGSLSALEVKGASYRSLALTVLGGSRGYSVRDVLRLLMQKSLDWLSHSRSMTRVDLHVFEPEHAALWTEAMNEAVGREAFKEAGSVVVQALSEEIRARLTSLQWLSEGDLNLKVTAPLLRALAGDKATGLPLQWLTTPGRVLAEYVVSHLIASQPAWTGSPKHDLYARIESLHGFIEEWMVYHLHVLRVCGNEGAHLRDGRAALREVDLPALLVSLLRVILWWDERSSRKPAAVRKLR
ncbi:hypothetical protein ACFL59_08895 [Planctomycetota bacterium]